MKDPYAVLPFYLCGAPPTNTNLKAPPTHDSTALRADTDRGRRVGLPNWQAYSAGIACRVLCWIHLVGETETTAEEGEKEKKMVLSLLRV